MGSMTSTPPRGGPSSARSILIIEDNDDARGAMAALLELDGYSVAEAREGADGIEIACTKRPDLALVDIGLPGIDGYEVARRLRATLGRSIVLVALTGYGEPEDRQKAVDAGFDAHLVKPIDPAQLTTVLTRGTPGPGSRG